MRKPIFTWILAVGLFSPSVASADANLCNNTGREIWATYGEQYAFNMGGPGKDWIIGWYDIQPGQCAKPVVGDVCFWWAWVWNNCAAAILYYADDAAGDQWGGWGATLYPTICTTNNAFYENPQYDWGTPSCPSDRVWRFWGGWFYPQPSDDIMITFQ